MTRSYPAAALFILAMVPTAPRAHAGPPYTAGWIPALEDAPACVLTISDEFRRRALWAECRPRGWADLRNGRLRFILDLHLCPVSTTTEFELLADTIVLPPSPPCLCAPAGCCQPPPQPTTFAAAVSARDGVIRFGHALPIANGTQVEIRRIELRESGDCFSTDATDISTGTFRHVTAGRAVVAAGVGVPRQRQ